jgi:hypothetical protein
MSNKSVTSRAAGLSDSDLLSHVARLATHEREATVELVAHLAELEVRKLHLAEGYGSLFAYCTGALRLAEHAAYNRIEAARVSRRFPVVLELLGDGSLNLSTLRLLAPHLQPDNFEALVGRARDRSKREVEALVAELAPQPDVLATLRKLPERRPIPTILQEAPRCVASSQVKDSRAEPLEPPLAADRLVVAPLSPGRYRLQFTMSAPTHQKLRLAQDLLRREVPDGNPDSIIDRALTLLLEDVARRKLAGASKPRSLRRTSSGSRHIPAPIKRAVWLRDGGRCAFVSRRGRHCGERVFLEFHHREPYAIGGEATAANISLRCRAHNLYEDELLFGPRGAGRRSLTTTFGSQRSTRAAP